MTPIAEDLYQKALELSDDERAALAARLIESLDEQEPEEEVEAAWRQEIERRMAELEAGTVETVSWGEVRAKLLGTDAAGER